jgi:hypothetical protein
MCRAAVNQRVRRLYNPDESLEGFFFLKKGLQFISGPSAPSLDIYLKRWVIGNHFNGFSRRHLLALSPKHDDRHGAAKILAVQGLVGHSRLLLKQKDGWMSAFFFAALSPVVWGFGTKGTAIRRGSSMI